MTLAESEHHSWLSEGYQDQWRCSTVNRTSARFYLLCYVVQSEEGHRSHMLGAVRLKWRSSQKDKIHSIILCSWQRKGALSISMLVEISKTHEVLYELQTEKSFITKNRKSRTTHGWLRQCHYRPEMRDDHLWFSVALEQGGKIYSWQINLSFSFSSFRM